MARDRLLDLYVIGFFLF